MKKIFLILLCLLCGTFSLQAKGIRMNLPQKMRISVFQGKVKTHLKTSGKTIGILRKNQLPATDRNAVGRQTQKALQALQHALIFSPKTAPKQPPAPFAPLERYFASMQIKQPSPDTENLQPNLASTVLFSPIMKIPYHGFSITTVKVGDETFGVIATHALPDTFYTFDYSLHRTFHVYIKQPDGKKLVFPAEVVQFSPQSMLDISLVKFPRITEIYLNPLEIASTPAAENEVLSSFGFAAGQFVDPVERTVQQSSFISVRTDQNLSGDRRGFCGSPLVDKTGKLKAIHTGTKSSKEEDKPDVSYGTHAHFINLLVEAYHNNGQAHYDVIINGQKMLHLNIDEYLTSFTLFDARGKVLVDTDIDGKFPQALIEKALNENPQAAYVRFVTRKAYWEVDSDGDSILKEDRTDLDKTQVSHWYNLLTKQIQRTRPPVIKKGWSAGR